MKYCNFIAPILAPSIVGIFFTSATYAACGGTLPSNAGVEVIPSTSSQGLTGPIKEIAVHPGEGVNLDYASLGMLVKRAWLDDPSRVLLDFDSPLCRTGEMAEGQQQDCRNVGARFIHLKRINPINFNMPQTPRTLLTVILESPDGAKRELHQYRIAYGTGKPKVNTFTICPTSVARTNTSPSGNPTSVPVQPVSSSLSGTSTQYPPLKVPPLNIRSAYEGFKIAKSKNMFMGEESQMLVAGIERFFLLTQQGKDVASALNESQVPPQQLVTALKNLESIGQSQTPVAPTR